MEIARILGLYRVEKNAILNSNENISNNLISKPIFF